MQQQAALMAASHGGYLTPSVAFPATQIHQMGALNINSLPPTPMTPVSGEFHQSLGEQLRLISSFTGPGWRRGLTLFRSAGHHCAGRQRFGFLFSLLWAHTWSNSFRSSAPLIIQALMSWVWCVWKQEECTAIHSSLFPRPQRQSMQGLVVSTSQIQSLIPLEQSLNTFSF